jgi:CRISPR-associated protein Cas2
VVYDISLNAERGRVDRLLKGYGFRVQKSVFECRLTKRDRLELVERLGALCIKSGFVKVYRLEHSFGEVEVGEGGKRNEIDHGFAYII